MADLRGTDVAKNTRAQCPRCGTENDIGFLGSISVSNNAGGNIMVRCWNCGEMWDVTGGVDGTYVTGDDGHLRLRQAVFEASAAILSRPVPRADLEAAIEALRHPAAGPVPDELEDLEGFRRLWQWMNENPAFGYLVAPFIVGVLLLVLQRATDDPPPKPAPAPAPEVSVNVTVESPSPADLRQMVDEILRAQTEGQPPPAGPASSDTTGP